MTWAREIRKIARSVFEELIPGVRTHLATVITSYDGATNTCKAQPTRRTIRVEDPDNMTTVDLPELQDVPVMQFGSGKLLLSCAPQPDSYGVAHVSDRDIEDWFSNGGVTDPKSIRTHDLSDSFLHHGVYTLKEDGDNGLIVEPIRTDRIELRTRSGKTNISVLDDESISITTEHSVITINASGEISIANDDSSMILTSEVDISSSGTVTINGNLTVDP
jgi:hypothetical protein